MRGDIIKLSETEAVARAHVVSMERKGDALTVYLSTGLWYAVEGDDARRVWREWVTDTQSMADLLCDYGRALREIAKLGEWGELGEKVELHGVLLKVAKIAREALDKERKEKEQAR